MKDQTDSLIIINKKKHNSHNNNALKKQTFENKAVILKLDY